MMGSLQPIRILLLEDDSIDAEAVARQLRKSSPNFEFTWAETLVQALGILESKKHD